MAARGLGEEDTSVAVGMPFLKPRQIFSLPHVSKMCCDCGTTVSFCVCDLVLMLSDTTIRLDTAHPYRTSIPVWLVIICNI
jgi:PHP family Zn ribbon phosphoesterase